VPGTRSEAAILAGYQSCSDFLTGWIE